MFLASLTVGVIVSIVTLIHTSYIGFSTAAVLYATALAGLVSAAFVASLGPDVAEWFDKRADARLRRARERSAAAAAHLAELEAKADALLGRSASTPMVTTDESDDLLDLDLDEFGYDEKRDDLRQLAIERGDEPFGPRSVW